MTASSRLGNQNPQYFSNDGTQVLAGGSLTFSDSGTSTPKDTFSDPGLTTPNTNPVILDASGRATTDIWLDGNYRVVLADSTGAVVWTRDYVQTLAEAGNGSTLPSPASGTGEFLSSDGTNYIWAPVLQVPSPTGQTNKVLSNDGANIIWINPPTNGTPGTNASVTVTATDVKWSGGSGSLAHYQMGAGSAPASGGHGTSTTITFPVAFATMPVVMASVSSTTFATSGYLAAVSITSVSLTGFTISFDTNSSDGSNGNIIADVTFNWIAFGTTTS